VSFPSACILDACFVIDWARWRRRNLLKELFSMGFIPEITLREIITEKPLKMVRDLVTDGWLTAYPHSRELEEEAMRLILDLRKDPRIPRIDPPEATCVVLARRFGLAVLTENRGIIRAYRLFEDRFHPAVVLNSLRLLAHIFVRGLAGETSFSDLINEYERDSSHSFSLLEVRTVAREFGIEKA
jgi:hypothetical protein